MIIGYDGQPDYEAMILARQEAYEISGDCEGYCVGCTLKEYCHMSEATEGDYDERYDNI